MAIFFYFLTSINPMIYQQIDIYEVITSSCLLLNSIFPRIVLGFCLKFFGMISCQTKHKLSSCLKFWIRFFFSFWKWKLMLLNVEVTFLFVCMYYPFHFSQTELWLTLTLKSQALLFLSLVLLSFAISFTIVLGDWWIDLS